MKYYDWNVDKNEWLKEERDVSFDEAVEAINEGKLIDVKDNPNDKKYKNQKIYVVEIKNYVYLVPFVEDENRIFLKTIYPSRKATKEYLIKFKKI